MPRGSHWTCARCGKINWIALTCDECGAIDESLPLDSTIRIDEDYDPLLERLRSAHPERRKL